MDYILKDHIGCRVNYSEARVEVGDMLGGYCGDAGETRMWLHLRIFDYR